MDFQVDLSNEASYEYVAVTARRRGRRVFLLLFAVVFCLGLGAGLGYLLAHVAEEPQPDLASEDAVPERDRTEDLVGLHLAGMAVDEASQAVAAGVGDAHRVQTAVSISSSTGEAMPVRIRSNGPEVRVRVDGDEAERVSRDVYRVGSSRRLEVEVDPLRRPRGGAEELEISIQPLMDFDLVDPYADDR